MAIRLWPVSPPSQETLTNNGRRWFLWRSPRISCCAAGKSTWRERANGQLICRSCVKSSFHSMAAVCHWRLLACFIFWNTRFQHDFFCKMMQNVYALLLYLLYKYIEIWFIDEVFRSFFDKQLPSCDQDCRNDLPHQWCSLLPMHQPKWMLLQHLSRWVIAGCLPGATLRGQGKRHNQTESNSETRLERDFRDGSKFKVFFLFCGRNAACRLSSKNFSWKLQNFESDQLCSNTHAETWAKPKSMTFSKSLPSVILLRGSPRFSFIPARQWAQHGLAHFFQLDSHTNRPNGVCLRVLEPGTFNPVHGGGGVPGVCWTRTVVPCESMRPKIEKNRSGTPHGKPAVSSLLVENSCCNWWVRQLMKPAAVNCRQRWITDPTREVKLKARLRFIVRGVESTLTVGSIWEHFFWVLWVYDVWGNCHTEQFLVLQRFEMGWVGWQIPLFDVIWRKRHLQLVPCLNFLNKSVKQKRWWLFAWRWS